VSGDVLCDAQLLQLPGVLLATVALVLAQRLRRERQSSSGVIISTGTGATGWTSSIVRQRGIEDALPSPADRRLTYMVREPWPSVATGTDINFGFVNEGEEIELVSEMEEGGVIFGDGIESDFLEFNEGQTVKVTIARRTLNLVVPAMTVVAAR